MGIGATYESIGESMKIVITEGCTAFNTSFDDVNLEDMTTEQANKILDQILAKIRKDVIENAITLNSVIQLMQYDSYETTNEPCEQCGDTVSTTTWEI